MITGSVIWGKSEIGVIVCTPLPEILKAMVSVSLAVGVPLICDFSDAVSAATESVRLQISIASRSVSTLSRASVSRTELTAMVAAKRERSSSGSRSKRRERAGPASERRERKGREKAGIGERSQQKPGE